MADWDSKDIHKDVFDGKLKHQISSEEWNRIKSSLYDDSDSFKKPFWELFHINCRKCGSDNVEMFGDCDVETGYYEEITNTTFIVIKCHDCGNAKIFKKGSLCGERIDLE